ncbi:unnamed protein product [Bursaphelenchus xylophilus]|uniref:(pine wood nematode) hypothetical protein n=1 Tax=Bursaphelenchus xylophilus TaxID=6326 RepID=A0A1I7RV65_BURXY|nr:unnamed protein product [Bursaphelenchus xylophilus]CAG9124656.1 unnamed protein product [Bursaphelenchus xylophilus]
MSEGLVKNELPDSNPPTTSTSPNYELKPAGRPNPDNNNCIYANQQFETNYIVMNDQEPSSLSAYLSTTFNLLESDPSQNSCFRSNQEQKAVYYDRSQTYYQQPVQMNGYPQYMMVDREAMSNRCQDYNYEPAEKRQRFPSTVRQCQQEYTDNFRRFINIPSTSTGPSSAPATNNSEDSGVQSPDGSEDSDGSVSGGGTVMCPACKNVYNSPRSLTGHIGRTEKCREAIGRDYLEDIMKRGDSVCIPDATAPGEGISPVCPHCNRFISHYKGNIRRHVNSCKRTSPRKESNASETMTPFGYSGISSSSGSTASSFDLATPSASTTSNPSAMSLEDQAPCSSAASTTSTSTVVPKPDLMLQPPTHHYAPQQPPTYHMGGYMHPEDPVVHQMQMPPQHLPHGYVDYMPYDMPIPMHQQMYQPVYGQMDMVPPQQMAPLQQEQPAPTKSRPPKHNGMVTPDDPYVCSWCTFTTVYKGNMKRHLISCHNCNDELLRKYNFELERLRKSAACRAGPDSLPFIEIRPAQPPGTRRPRNANSNSKNMGRPKKDKEIKREQVMMDQPKMMHEQGMGYVDGNGIQYSVVPPPQTMDSYEMSMQFMNQPAQVLSAPNASYGLIKDCGNDSGLGIQDEFGEVNQPPPLPGY